MAWLFNTQLALADRNPARPSAILSVFQPRLKANYPSDLRSQAQGMLSTFYVEAVDGGSVTRSLNRAHDSGYRFTLSTVDKTEFMDLFPRYSQSEGLRAGSWVQFTEGEYVNDVAFVDSMSDPIEDERRATVWAVPRLHLPPVPKPSTLRPEDREGEEEEGELLQSDEEEPSVQPEIQTKVYRYGQRPIRAPFDVDKMRQLYGPESVKEDDTLYVFDKQHFRCGLIRLETPARGLVLRPRFSFTTYSAFSNSHIARATVERYFQSHYIRSLTVGDRVEIIEGEQAHAVASIADITGDSALVVLTSVQLAVDVPLRSLRRHFIVGDSVAVVAGVDCGKWGNVTSVVDGVVTLVSPDATQEVWSNTVAMTCVIQLTAI